MQTNLTKQTRVCISIESIYIRDVHRCLLEAEVRLSRMVSTAIQLFTVCEADETLRSIVDRADEAGYDGVEYNEEWFPILTDAGNERQVSADIPETRVPETPGVQVPLEILENCFSDVVPAYEKLGCQDFVVPYIDEACFETRDAIGDTADRLRAVGERLVSRGARLHYHNHDFEFSAVDDRTGYELLVEETENIYFQLDVGWAAAAGEEPTELLERYADRIDLVHLKDMIVESSTPAELGEGDVDMEACAETAEAIGAGWIIYEYDWPPEPLASLAHGAAWFKENGY